jgi:hypothetical protein
MKYGTIYLLVIAILVVVSAQTPSQNNNTTIPVDIVLSNETTKFSIPVMIQTSKKLLIHGCMYLFQGIFVRDIICILFKYTFKWNICQHIDMDTFFHNIFTSIQEPTEEENISESISITDSEVLILPQPNYVSSIMSQITQARDVSGNCSNAFMECQDVEFPVTCINRICESEIFRYCRSSDVRMCESALQHHYDLLIFENCKANDIE